MRTCITRLSRYLWHRDKATPTSSHFVRICLNCEMDIVRSHGNRTRDFSIAEKKKTRFKMAYALREQLAITFPKPIFHQILINRL